MVDCPGAFTGNKRWSHRGAGLFMDSHVQFELGGLGVGGVRGGKCTIRSTCGRMGVKSVNGWMLGREGGGWVALLVTAKKRSLSGAMEEQGNRGGHKGGVCVGGGEGGGVIGGAVGEGSGGGVDGDGGGGES